MDKLILLIKQKRFKDAEVMLRKSLASAPNDVYLLTQLANVLWNRCIDEEALYYADMAKSISEHYPLLLYTRGRILWTMERYEESAKEWTTILETHEKDDYVRGWGTRWTKSVVNDARYYMADCLFHQYRDQEALPLIEEHLKHRKKGLQSDFSKKEAILFYKVLKYSHCNDKVDASDDGYANDAQKKRISKRIDKLKQGADWEKMVRYLKTVSAHYPKEYWLATVLSEYCSIIGENEESLNYATAAFKESPYDPLVIYRYAIALWINGRNDEALSQFESIMSLGEDYIAYSEHGEGMAWARKLLRETKRYVSKINNHCSPM